MAIVKAGSKKEKPASGFCARLPQARLRTCPGRRVRGLMKDAIVSSLESAPRWSDVLLEEHRPARARRGPGGGTHGRNRRRALCVGTTGRSSRADRGCRFERRTLVALSAREEGDPG